MVSRRRFLQYGFATGLALTPTGRRTPDAATAAPPGTWGAWCDLSDKSLQATAIDVEAAATPAFAVELPIPPVLAPVDRDATTDRYRVTMRTNDVEVVPGATTRIWGYEGAWPGPTIVAERGRTALVEQVNALSVPTTVHLHGAHVAPADDGHPLDLIAPGASKTYRYPNTQAAATLWYHDHTHHATARNVYRGLAGLYLIHDPAEESLGLPSGSRDIPLVVQDRTFGTDGSLVYPEGNTNGFFGQTICVNGAPQPYLEVERTRYRFRLLNGSNARQYEFALADGTPLTLVGTDGGLLPRPVEVAAVAVSPAERVEFVIDFAAVAGTSVVLRNRLATGALTEVMRFDLTGSPVTSGALPDALSPVPVLSGASVTREVLLTLEDGVWVIDGKRYDPDRVDQYPKLGATEIWRFTAPADRSPMPHPFHLHLVMFQVLDRNGAAPQPWERGWKDTVTVAPGDTVTVIARFTGHIGTYVYHCHNLEHEDHDMMAQFKVVDLPRFAGAGRVETAAAVSRATTESGVPVAFVATATSFPDALAGGPVAAGRGGPLLLTAGASLPTATRAELERLAPSEIVVLGGDRAVPTSVERELATLAPRVTRIAGADRFATAAATSRSFFAPGVPAVYIATGVDFPDALAGGAAAASRGAPLLLVDHSGVPTSTAEEIRRLRPQEIVVLGGTAVIPADVEAELRTYGAPVRRIAGSDRYATAAAVSAASFDEATTVYVATGTAFPDALAGVPAAGRERAPLLLVASDGVPAIVGREIARLAPRRIVILGGPAAVGEAAEHALADLLPSGLALT